MILKAKRVKTDEEFQEEMRGTHKFIDVEVPDPQVLCELKDVRVVATFEPYVHWEEYPDVDSLEPQLVVEIATGTDALGVEHWQKAKGEPLVVTRLVTMLKDLLWKPPAYRVITNGLPEEF